MGDGCVGARVGLHTCECERREVEDAVAHVGGQIACVAQEGYTQESVQVAWSFARV